MDIDESGDAHWTIESRFVLHDDDDIDDFEQFASAVTAGERDIAINRQLFEAHAHDAADRTDRHMSIENAGWDEPRVNPVAEDDVVDAETIETDDGDGETVHVGVITYSFTWTNFATTENDRIYFGDAFQTDTGVWLTLTDTQRLIIEPPADYALETPTQLDWDGPYEFGDGELDIVFVHSGATSGFDISSWMIAAVFALVLFVGIGSYLLARWKPEIDLPQPVDQLAERVSQLGRTGLGNRLRSRGGTRGEQEHDSSMATDTNGGSVQPGAGPTAVGNTDAADAAAGTQLEFEEEVDEEIDPELLSDEERVLRLLKQNGGRMKQASIVTETGWSNAKVSQLLSQMDDDDDIEKLRIGRENLITLPEVNPAEFD
ncbi:hypothetical protein GS429_04630 [Natronorubrum sp. JWXQ-INN-674]|uniref:HTH iclR-type domain-containing protein n=1 Tax=Natronorubrum halalkaliphilum TaxID=2691917 RepID=A0A6B0VII0_9EURY|nr:hypothetical protein [Natronorubrum halalkaliphilum]